MPPIFWLLVLRAACRTSLLVFIRLLVFVLARPLVFALPLVFARPLVFRDAGRAPPLAGLRRIRGRLLRTRNGPRT